MTSRRCGFTLVELLAAIAIISILALLILTGLSRVREAARRGTCQGNLKQIGIALKMYAQESQGELYPPMMRFTSVDSLPGGVEIYVAPCALPNPPREGGKVQGTFDWPSVYPEYLADPRISICPSDIHKAIPKSTGRWHRDIDKDGKGDLEGPIDACAITSESYAYIGWAVQSIDSDNPAAFIPIADYISAVLRVYSRRLTEGPGVFDEDLVGHLSERPLYRLREGIERFFITDINSHSGDASTKLPVMYDLVSVTVEPFNHAPAGSNVLFLDGHVEFSKYPGPFPVLPEYAAVAEFLGA